MNDQKPVISVIVPVYNSGKTVSRCIKSILNQTYPSVRIILVDDGSTDNSLSICKRYSIRHANVLVLHKDNGGVMSARNYGILHIPDEGLTTFCDSDDCLLPNSIEKLFSLYDESHADVSCGTVIKRYGALYKKAVIPPIMRIKNVFCGDMVRTTLLPSFFGITNFPGWMCAKLYRNSFLKRSLDFTNPVRFFQEDIAFNLQMLLISDSVAVMPDGVYLYNQTGATSHFMPSFLDDCISLCKFKRDIIHRENLSLSLQKTTLIELKNETFTWFYMYAIEYYSRGESFIKAEIARCIGISAIREAASIRENPESGEIGFSNDIINNNIDNIYSSVINKIHKDKSKLTIKRFLNSVHW